MTPTEFVSLALARARWANAGYVRMGRFGPTVRLSTLLAVVIALGTLLTLVFIVREPFVSRVWHELFDPAYVTMLRPADALRWWAMFVVLGLAVSPLTQDLTRHLPDRGFALNKGVGLLIASYLAWLAGSLHLLPYSDTSPWVWVALLVAISFGLAWLLRIPVPRPTRASLKRWLLCEATFGVLFYLFLILEVHNPYTPIHHGVAGSDTAMVLAIGRSDWFPPMDPWLSGWRLNYYYLGHVQQSLLWRLTDTEVGVGNSLSMVTIMTLATLLTLSTGWALTRRWWIGALSAITVGFATNLDVVAQAIDKQTLVNVPVTPSEHLVPQTLTAPPFVTFTLGELHAELLAIPMLALVCAVLVGFVIAHAEQTSLGRRLLVLFVVALSVGIVGVTNLYSLPEAVGLCALLFLALAIREGSWRYLVEGFVAVAFSFLAFLPFYATYRTVGSSAIIPNPVATSPVAIGLMFGMFLLPILAWAYLSAIRPSPAHESTSPWVSWLPLLVAGEIAVAVIVAVLALQGTGFGAGALLLIAATLVCIERAISTARSGGDTRSIMAWTMAVIGCGALAGIEVVSLDIKFSEAVATRTVMVPMRFNIAWKTYLSVWIPLTLAASVAIAVLLDWSATRPARFVARAAATAGVILMLLGGMSGAFFAAGRMHAFLEHPGLDGLVFMQTGPLREQDDLEVIRWLTKNAKDEDVVLETPGGSVYPNMRISSFTGLATLFGWDHAVEAWQDNPQTVTLERKSDAAAIYTNTDPEQTKRLLDKYDVRYIVLSGLEDTTYGKVDRDGLMQIAPVVFRARDAFLLRVPDEIARVEPLTPRVPGFVTPVLVFICAALLVAAAWTIRARWRHASGVLATDHQA